ncbi:MAG: hypothetical protein C0442_11180 [Chlorobiaceae bacterium]|nr:hypothetical protein [Chlorobiaceae bacterium]
MHDLVNKLSKYNGKTPTQVIENALEYQRLDFRMRHISLQEQKTESVLVIRDKWQRNEYISPEEYAFLVGVIQRNYINNYNVGIKPVVVLVEITKKIQLFLDANKIDYDKNHINQYLQDGLLKSFMESGSSSTASLLLRPIEILNDYFNEIDPIRLHETFLPYMGLLLPVALYDEDTEHVVGHEIIKDNLDDGLKNISVDFGDIKVSLSNLLFFMFESRNFFLPIGGRGLLFLVHILQNWDRLNNMELFNGYQTLNYKDIKILKDQRKSEIVIHYHALHIYFTYEQFQELSKYISLKLPPEWSRILDITKLRMGSLW